MDELFSDDRHVEVEATWDVYQPMITAYRASSRTEGTKIMTRLIASIGSSVPASLVEVVRLGQTLTTRRDDILAFFDRPATSNGPTEAINGIIELGRRTARGYRNPTNYQLRMLLIAGGLDASTHTQL